MHRSEKESLNSRKRPSSTQIPEGSTEREGEEEETKFDTQYFGCGISCHPVFNKELTVMSFFFPHSNI